MGQNIGRRLGEQGLAGARAHRLGVGFDRAVLDLERLGAILAQHESPKRDPAVRDLRQSRNGSAA